MKILFFVAHAQLIMGAIAISCHGKMLKKQRSDVLIKTLRATNLNVAFLNIFRNS